MARIRTVKPEFFRHLNLFKSEKETSLPLRVAFAGLWTACDREGRFKWEPEVLKLDCLPFDSVDFARVLDALWTRGFVEKYQDKEKSYGFIPSWDIHQIINNRESESHLPEPNEINTLTREARVPHAIQGEGKGKEGKGKEGRVTDFDLFYKAYPKHEGKAEAKKVWEKLKPDYSLFQTMLKSIETFKKSEQWQKDSGKFIPHPATWLNQKRWEDELSLPAGLNNACRFINGVEYRGGYKVIR